MHLSLGYRFLYRYITTLKQDKDIYLFIIITVYRIDIIITVNINIDLGRDGSDDLEYKGVLTNEI